MAVSQPVESLSIHVYRKRQTSDSSLESLKIENEQIKTAQIILIWIKNCVKLLF